MTLENIFYVLAIIMMVLNFLLLIGIVVAGFILKNKIAKLQADIEKKIAETKAYISRPEQIATTVGAAVADAVIGQVTRIFKSKNPKK